MGGTTIMNGQEPDTAHPPQRPLDRVDQGWVVHYLAVGLVVVTFLLVVLGGIVTSKGVGLAVPDWPSTYGQSMFLFPPSMWRGGVFWEHTHRLLGAVVGLMTIAVAVGLWWSWPRRPRLVAMGIAAVVMVVVQGVMGGLRVTQLSTAMGVFHGVTAQLFLCLTVLIAAVTGRWCNVPGPLATARFADGAPRFGLAVRRWALVLLGVMAVQLVLGASMRHTDSRLAIPDFPSAYGRWVPPLGASAIRDAIDAQPYERFTRYYTPGQVGVHFAHRIWAVGLVAVACVFLTRLAVEARGDNRLVVPMVALLGLLLGQVALGAAVVWTGPHHANDEVATAHQAIGAVVLATATLLAFRVHALRPMPGKPAGAQARLGTLPEGVPV